jgi:hypothetical protein
VSTYTSICTPESMVIIKVATSFREGETYLRYRVHPVIALALHTDGSVVPLIMDELGRIIPGAGEHCLDQENVSRLVPNWETVRRDEEVKRIVHLLADVTKAIREGTDPKEVDFWDRSKWTSPDGALTPDQAALFGPIVPNPVP